MTASIPQSAEITADSLMLIDGALDEIFTAERVISPTFLWAMSLFVHTVSTFGGRWWKKIAKSTGNPSAEVKEN